MKTIPEMLTTVARQYAQRLAIVDGGMDVSYADLASRVAALATELSSLGVRQGDRVALLLPNGVHFVTSYLAIVTAGAIAVPLHEQYQQTELRFFLEACGISLLMTSQSFTQLVQQVLLQCQAPCEVLVVEHCPTAAKAEAQGGVMLPQHTGDVSILFRLNGTTQTHCAHACTVAL
jgi:acyl-CoA synthetase (AMP-forming)/AMP-acid ligase II